MKLEPEDREVIGVMLGLLFGVLFLCMGAYIGVRNISHYYDTVNCHKFSQTANRPTKFVNYSYWSWSCLTPSGHGTWIPISQLRSVN